MTYAQASVTSDPDGVMVRTHPALVNAAFRCAASAVRMPALIAGTCAMTICGCPSAMASFTASTHSSKNRFARAFMASGRADFEMMSMRGAYT